MVVGERTGLMQGRPNGVLIESGAGGVLAYAPALTKRSARRAWEMLLWEHQLGADFLAGATAMYRVEWRRIVERAPLVPRAEPPDDADAGVREPRRPRPPRGGTSAWVAPPAERWDY